LEGRQGFAVTIPGRFEGQVAIVTGGVSGIGAAVAARLAAEGAWVALWDVDAAALKGANAAHSEALDLTDAEAVERATASTAAALGGIDVLVNCAGITGPNASTSPRSPARRATRMPPRIRRARPP